MAKSPIMRNNCAVFCNFNFNFQSLRNKKTQQLIEPNLFHFIPVLFLDRDSILKEKEKSENTQK